MMGYTSGDVIMPSDSKACQTFNGLNYCGSDYQPIHMNNIICSGSESNLNDCNFEITTENCNHDTVIIFQQIFKIFD